MTQAATTMTTARIPNDLVQRLDAQARRLGVTKSELLRDALATHLASLGEDVVLIVEVEDATVVDVAISEAPHRTTNP